MNSLRSIYILFTAIILASFTTDNPKIGDVIDQLNGVAIYYNGKFTNVMGRNVAYNGYNLGLKFQCVEFVKRYYYDIYGHQMPNSYGHAREYFDDNLPDRAYNKNRGLMQYRNVREYAPRVGDILVYDKSYGNPFGHVGIIGEVGNDFVTLYQQNYGETSKVKLKLVKFMDYYTVADEEILGWLRKE